MRLYVNLIPALAHALVTMLFNVAGLNGEAEKPPRKMQIVSSSVKYCEFSRQNSTVIVARNGQVTLSNGFGKGNMEWRIPNIPDTKQIN